MPNDEILADQETSSPRIDDAKKLDAALRLYGEHRQDRRHFEDQREKLTHCVLLLAVAILGLLKLTGEKAEVNALLSALLVLIGFFGAFVTWRLCSRVTFEEDCMKECTAPITKLGFTLEQGRHETKLTQSAWIIINVLVVLLGSSLLLSYVHICLQP